MPNEFKCVDANQLPGPPPIIHIIPKSGCAVAAAMSAELVMVWRHVGGTRFIIDLTDVPGDKLNVTEFYSGLTGFGTMVGATRGSWALCGAPDFGRGLSSKGKLLACRGTEFTTLEEAVAALSS